MNPVAGRVPGVLAAVLLLLAVSPSSALQEREARGPPQERTLPPGAVTVDTIFSAPVTTEARVDRELVRRIGPAPVDVEARREALAGGDFPDRDAGFESLSGLSGYRIIEYRGETVELDVERERIHLDGSSQANYADASLRADSIVYRGPLQFLSARDDITLVSPDGQEVASDSVLYYDVSRRKGTVLQADTRFAEAGADWRVRGDAVPVGQDTLFVTKGSFTTCDIEEPHYYFRAGEIKYVNQDFIVAWPVTFYISDVPVFWLPFFAQDVRPERRSGILPPQFGFNQLIRTSDDLDRNVTDVGYYWAINRFLDAQVTVDWYSGRYTSLNAGFRYRDLKRFLNGNINIGHQWGERGRNLRIRFDHDQDLSPNTELRANGQFVQNTRLFQDRSFDPRDQTRTIDSEAGLDHEFPFASVSLSARRRQSLGADPRTELELPRLDLNFSPVTLFSAPRAQAGFFENITWTPNGRFSRRADQFEERDDEVTTRASLSQGFRLRDLSISASTNLDDVETTPLPPADGEETGTPIPDPEPLRRTTVNWNAGTSYRFDLVGQTTLSPSLDVDGALFRSEDPGDTIPDTGGRFVSTPARASIGANLRSEVYGFFPGFGPFSQIRHKLSPRLRWSYSPAVDLDPSLEEVPGFPGSRRARQELRVSLSQTFEAKVREQEADERPADAEGPETEGEAGTEAGEPEAEGEPGADAGEGDRALAEGSQEDEIEGPREQVEEEKVTLLSINTSALTFDFEGTEGEPLLTTTMLRNRFSSDLLRGVRLDIEHSLFEGSGTDRRFSPFLTSLSTNFTLRSGMSLGDIVGLGRSGGAPDATPPAAAEDFARDAGDGMTDFRASPEQPRLGPRDGSGPWSLTLSYSLNRSRPDAAGEDRQSLNGSLSLQPTPNWRVNWNTQYNITDREFGQHIVELVRDLHRWQARFSFRRSPNGNFSFSFLVNLLDAPDVRLDYEERSDPPGGVGPGPGGEQ